MASEQEDRIVQEEKGKDDTQGGQRALDPGVSLPPFPISPVT